MKVVIREDIVNELKRMGLEKNDVVMVHTSLKSMGYVCGGAQTVIEALIEVVGEEGTIMMPTQSWKNLDPEEGVHWDADENDWQRIRDNWPAYDKNITPSYFKKETQNILYLQPHLFIKWQFFFFLYQFFRMF